MGNVGKNEIELDSIAKNREMIGNILKAFRERNDLLQRDIARKLGYININFISMIEAGKASPPLGKLDKLVAAYNADPTIIPIILKFIYPDNWKSALSAIVSCPDIFQTNRNRKSIDKLVELHFRKLIRYYIV